MSEVLRPTTDQIAPVPAEDDDPGVDYGEVFTRRWIVEFILDLVGYTADRDLASTTIVEPSCGTGAFLVPIIDRLVESCERYGHDISELTKAVVACDVLAVNAERAHKAAVNRLVEAGLTEARATGLAGEWVRSSDFLLSATLPREVEFVVGNPPYVRLENVRSDVMQAYRSAWPTMRGRSDVYVGFIERGLGLLAEGGALGFICADRWMHNQYGADLRALVSASFGVDAIVTMHDVDAFEADVSAYPAVVVVKRQPQESIVVAEATNAFASDAAASLTAFIQQDERTSLAHASVSASRLDRWFTGRGLWPTGSPKQMAIVADLEARFSPLQNEATGTRVGIGVATGCDDVYVTRDPDVVEADRMLPLALPVDLDDGRVDWTGHFLVNPWNDTGLVTLDDYPRLKAYLDDHSIRLRARYVAKKRRETWYRTIDRVDPELRSRSKLLLPDLKARSHPVLDLGSVYPHHNLYFVVSEQWDLEVLGALLLSDFANLFVGSYCVKMRGGCYRFQAQYLRRICVPEIGAIDDATADRLRHAFQRHDRAAATVEAAQLYGIAADELLEALAVQGNGGGGDHN